MAVGCGGGTPPPASPAQPHSQLPASAVTRTRAWTGPGGMRVEAVDLAEGGTLVRATGVTSDVTGKVVRCEREQDGPYVYCRTTFHGRPWNILVQREGEGGYVSWTAYLPGAASRDGFRLQYSEEQSAKVNASQLYAEHQQQKKSGELDALQRFDRKGEEKAAQSRLDAEAKRTSDACGAPIDMKVAWGTVSDDQIKHKSVSGYCESLLDGLRNVCRFDAGKAFVKAHVHDAVCRLDGKADLSLAGHELRWAISFDTYNLSDKARDALLAMKPAGDEQSLGQRILVEQTSVCVDDSGKHAVLIGPTDTAFGGLAYGDGTTFYRIPVPRMLGEGWFLDPRQRNDKNNDNFRGYDLRVYSHVDPKPDQGTCKLVCGTRETQLKLLTGKAKADMLGRAKFEPSPNDRAPYALARDKRAYYYYVDHGNTPETAKDFRLYRGKRGRLRRLRMRDVASDSEGEIFESTNGKLRLFLGRNDAQWVQGKKTRDLVRLPIEQNYGLIYNQLGVYLGQRLGVPCDDF